MRNETVLNVSGAWQPAMQQQLFRGLLEAFSYPGRIATCADQGAPAWLSVLAALVDGETTLADPQQMLDEAWWPKLEARCASPEQAAFIVLDGGRAPEFNPDRSLGRLSPPPCRGRAREGVEMQEFKDSTPILAFPLQGGRNWLGSNELSGFNPRLGTLEAPEAGATLLLRVDSLHDETGGELTLHLSGPGIRQQTVLGVSGLHPAWIAARNAWVENFPLGIEMVLCDENRFAALPRTTRVVMGGAA